MLNPSTADAYQDDPTIRRCIGFAQDMGYGGIEVVNLFAYRTSDPKTLKAVLKNGGDAVGPRNDIAIRDALVNVNPVCGWGAMPGIEWRVKQVVGIIERSGLKPTCLARTSRGQPRHPLYLKKTCRPYVFSPL